MLLLKQTAANFSSATFNNFQAWILQKCFRMVSITIRNVLRNRNRQVPEMEEHVRQPPAKRQLNAVELFQTDSHSTIKVRILRKLFLYKNLKKLLGGCFQCCTEKTYNIFSKSCCDGAIKALGSC